MALPVCLKPRARGGVHRETEEYARRAHDHVLGVRKADHGVGEQDGGEDKHRTISLVQAPPADGFAAAPHEPPDDHRRCRRGHDRDRRPRMHRAHRQFPDEAPDAALWLREQDRRDRAHDVVDVEDPRPPFETTDEVGGFED